MNDINDMADPCYLGDSLTAGFDGLHLVLQANGPGGPTVYLDSGVWRALQHYAAELGWHDFTG